jgi:hypothetical protein
MIVAYVAAILTIGVVICQKYNREWNYFFGVMFFAGIPFAGLAEDGLVLAVWGYNLGLMVLIGFTLFAFLIEYYLTGEWEMAV